MNKALLIICDGWGYRRNRRYNAIAASQKPNFDYLWKHYPHAVLAASGEAVGLPEGQIGTSEANHLTIGAGRITYHNLLKINHAIKNNAFLTNKAIQEAFNHVKKYQSTLHLKGIASSGGVHGHIKHLEALVLAAKKAGVKKVMLHLFTDGRDTPPFSAIGFVKDFELFLKSVGVGKVATIGGRYWGMDRDNNAERIEKHFKVMVIGEGPRYKSPIEVIEDAYSRKISDEFIEPALIEGGLEEIGSIQSNDAIIFANFRADRANQLTRRFLKSKLHNLKYITMTKYADDFDVRVAFPPEEITNSLSAVLSQNNLRQLRVTETEKFTHLTFFFNGQRFTPDPGEDRVMIRTNKDVKTHDQKPAMKVRGISKTVIEAMNKKTHDFICANLVNADMVGHTGNFSATVKAIESIDQCLGKILDAAKRNNVNLLITADHGNAEEMFNEETKQPVTAHTVNPVPFILFSNKFKKLTRKKGLLSDIAPTILKIFNLPIPKEMTGKSLINTL